MYQQLSLPLSRPSKRALRDIKPQTYSAIKKLRASGARCWRQGRQHFVNGRLVSTRQLLKLAQAVTSMRALRVPGPVRVACVMAIAAAIGAMVFAQPAAADQAGLLRAIMQLEATAVVGVTPDQFRAIRLQLATEALIWHHDTGRAIPAAVSKLSDLASAAQDDRSKVNGLAAACEAAAAEVR